MSIFSIGGGNASGDYEIDQSLRFNEPDDPKLSKTLGASGDRLSWTVSFWFKLTTTVVSGDEIHPFSADDVGGSNGWFDYIKIIPSTGVLQWNIVQASGSNIEGKLITTRVLRDPSAWYHGVFRWDSANAVAGDRMRIWINGEEVTSFSTDTNPAQNHPTTYFNTSGKNQAIGNAYSATTQQYDGYLAEVHFIDGQSLDASSFGETNSDTNQWVPIEVTGMTYGTNGFYQKYSATELANSFTDDSGGYLVPSGVTSVEVLVVGGGGAGSGGGNGGGGGGAGGLVYISNYAVTPGERISVTVGAGGAAQAAGTSGNDGANSVFKNITAIGGGGGGEGAVGRNGGSGGGGWQTGSTAGGTSTQTTTNDGYTSTGFGNAGGQGGSGSPHQGGGGGGAGAVGVAGQGSGGISSIPTGGNGGVGKAYTIADGSTSVTYAGGGGGGVTTGTDTGQGGSGGGGRAGYGSSGSYYEPVAGTANTGGGGGGGRNDGGGAAGGSGVVIIYDGTTRTIFNSSNVPHTITANGDVANTRAQYKVGNSSINFDGTGDYLTAPSSDAWDFGTGEFTLEMWIRFVNKKTGAGAAGANALLANHNSPNGWQWIWRGSDNTFELWATDGSEYASSFTLNNDTWYHVAVTRDNNTLRHYVDGVQCGSNAFTETMSDTSTTLQIGAYDASGLGLIDGYMDEIRISNTCRYPDGTTFTPSTTAFTADANTKLLIHSDFNGGLGADSSGNKNDFAVTNITVSDQVLDSPTNNFCTWNPIDIFAANLAGVVSEGNLKIVDSTNHIAYRGTYGLKSGKWYWEIYMITIGAAANCRTGICKTNTYGTSSGTGPVDMGVSYTYDADGQKTIPGSTGAYGATYAAGDIVGVALDMDNGTITFYKNNATQGQMTSGITDEVAPLVCEGNGGAQFDSIANFGQDSSFAGAKTAQGNGGTGEDFYYTPPTGYKALNSSNLDDPAIALPTDHFNTTLWTGNGSSGTSRAITGVGHAPDLVWLKNRDYGASHDLYDSVRGGNKNLHSNSTDAEVTNIDGGWIDSFDSDGFTLQIGGGGANEWYDNRNGNNIVSWSWKAGGAASSNGDGSITSSVSANPTAGFSIISFTGDGNAGATVGHGLSQAPEFWITKNRASAYAWFTGTPEYPSPAGNYYIQLDTGMAAASNTGIWNGTLPSSTVITLGNLGSAQNNSGDAHISYAFHSVEGYSKVGSYTGNANADGPFIYTGFRPAFFLWKNTASTTSWGITDNKRAGYNPKDYQLYADASVVEATSYHMVNFLSNGVKITNTDGTLNGSGNKIFFMAFAESPFKTANAR